MNDLNHVAIIMDGNGRWAESRNKPRVYGHYCGTKKILEIIIASIKNKIRNISFFAFSVENWQRPKKEVDYLLKLLVENLNVNSKAVKRFMELGVRIKIIGFRDNLSENICNIIDKVEKITENNSNINVNIFFNYSGVADINNAFKISMCDSSKKINIKEYLLTKDIPNVDLLIRTSGEQRISNFMLYEIAYSEIIFEKTLWPDYGKKIFTDNIKEYNNRNRKFGKICD
ncbi:MAG: polyprenyl diphosphate synthase [Malacoplasma sp.]